MNNWLRFQPLNLKQITGVIDIKLLCTEDIANIVQEVCTPNNDLTPVCVLRSARYHFSRVGGWAKKYAPARDRDERKKRKVPCMLALGSCFPLGWTLAFGLRLEWHARCGGARLQATAELAVTTAFYLLGPSMRFHSTVTEIEAEAKSYAGDKWIDTRIQRALEKYKWGLSLCS